MYGLCSFRKGNNHGDPLRSATQVILSGNFELRDSFGERTIFTQDKSDDVARTSKNLSNAAKEAGLYVNRNWRITFRGLRSGYLCRTFLSDIRLYGDVREGTEQKMIEHIGWKNVQSMAPCRRYITLSLCLTAKQLEPEENDIALDVIHASMDGMVPIFESLITFSATLNMNENELTNIIYNNEHKSLSAK